MPSVHEKVAQARVVLGQEARGRNDQFGDFLSGVPGRGSPVEHQWEDRRQELSGFDGA